jgi:hypothetical protein
MRVYEFTRLRGYEISLRGFPLNSQFSIFVAFSSNYSKRFDISTFMSTAVPLSLERGTIVVALHIRFPSEQEIRSLLFLERI